GDVVLVPFPFTDLSNAKQRPALVVSGDAFNSTREDVLVAAITSGRGAQNWTENRALKILAVSRSGDSKKPAERFHRLWRGEEKLRLFDPVFHPIAFAFEEHRLGVMEQTIEHGGSNGGVVIEDTRPVLVDLIGRDEGRAFLVAATDNLEQKISPGLVDG